MFKVLIDDFKTAISKRDNLLVLFLLITLAWFLVKEGIVPLLSTLFNAPSFPNLVHLNLKIPDIFLFFWNTVLFPFEISGIFNFLFSCMFMNTFGNILSDFIGGKKFFRIALFSGYLALLSLILLNVVWYLITGDTKLTFLSGGLGFSIIGVIFAILALSPTYEISIFSFQLKLIWVVLFYVLFACIYNPIYIFAFLVSAVFGHYYIKNMKGEIEFLVNFTNWFKRTPKKADFTIHKNAEYGKSAGKKSYFPDQEEIDFLLDKINNQGGYEALSADEKERLKRASSMKE